jgi:homoserine O-acetyltransferase
MNANVPNIKIDANIKDVAILMMSKNVTHLPVITNDNKLLGIVTAWDLSKSIAINCSRLNDIMTKNLKTCKSNETIQTIASKMKKYDISCLPVVNDEYKLEGIITTDQISHLMN